MITLKAKKIPTINVNDGLIAAADYFVGPDAYQNGELAAEWVSKKLGDKGDVAIVIGMAKLSQLVKEQQDSRDGSKTTIQDLT